MNFSLFISEEKKLLSFLKAVAIKPLSIPNEVFKVFFYCVMLALGIILNSAIFTANSK